MYESIRIQNFRGLKDLTIENLGRVNLLVGANNVGKTSVLEALWLLGNPTAPEKLIDLARFRRGDDETRLSPESVWFSLFQGLDAASPVVLTARGGSREVGEIEESLSIFFDPQATNVVRNGGGRRSGSEALHFIFETDETSRSLETRMTFDSDGEFAGPNRRIEGRSSEYLPVGRSVSSRDLAAKFTRAEDEGYLFRAVDALAFTEPRAESMSLGFSEAEGRPYVRVRISGVAKSVPLDVLGSGSRRMLDMVLSAIDAASGTLLVDEIGEGFYYPTLPDVWRGLHGLTLTGDSQMFASTHSWECVEAAVHAFDGDRADDFRLIRLEREADAVHAVTAVHHQVESTVALGFDVR